MRSATIIPCNTHATCRGASLISMFSLLSALMLSLLVVAGVHADERDGHGWALVEDEMVRRGVPDLRKYVILHLPPRADRAGGQRGIVRPSQWLLKRPERLSWEDNRVYFVMPPETIVAEGRRSIRRVMSFKTELSVASAWVYEPSDGPELLPSLPGEGELMGFAGTGSGPAALLLHGNPPVHEAEAPGVAGESDPAATKARVAVMHAKSQPLGGALRLLVLVGRDWVDISLPWQLDAAAPGTDAGTMPASGAEGQSVAEPVLGAKGQTEDRVHLVSTPGGLGLLIRRAGSASGEWWTGKFSLVADATKPSRTRPEIVWSKAAVGLADSSGNAVQIDAVFGLDGHPLALAWNEGVLTAWLLMDTHAVQIARKEGVTRGYRVASRSGSPGVLSVLWGEDRPEPPAKADGKPGDKPGKVARPQPTSYQLFEIFVTGRVLYDGAVKQDGPLSLREVQFISAVLGGVLLAVIVFVLKPEHKPSERLTKQIPPGFLLAGMGRRLIAAMIDFLIGIGIAKGILGVDWTHVLDPNFIASPTGGLTLLWIAAIVTWIHSSVGEWQFGRSLGKVVTDCRVISVLPDAVPAKTAPTSTTSASTPGSATPDPAEMEKRLQPRFWQAVMRNLLKWIPPLCIAVLLGPRSRHFGDQVAGTLVIEPEPPNVDIEE